MPCQNRLGLRSWWLWEHRSIRQRKLQAMPPFRQKYGSFLYHIKKLRESWNCGLLLALTINTHLQPKSRSKQCTPHYRQNQISQKRYPNRCSALICLLPPLGWRKETKFKGCHLYDRWSFTRWRKRPCQPDAQAWCEDIFAWYWQTLQHETVASDVRKPS